MVEFRPPTGNLLNLCRPQRWSRVVDFRPTTRRVSPFTEIELGGRLPTTLREPNLLAPPTEIQHQHQHQHQIQEIRSYIGSRVILNTSSTQLFTRKRALLLKCQGISVISTALIASRSTAVYSSPRRAKLSASFAMRAGLMPRGSLHRKTLCRLASSRLLITLPLLIKFPIR